MAPLTVRGGREGLWPPSLYRKGVLALGGRRSIVFLPHLSILRGSCRVARAPTKDRTGKKGGANAPVQGVNGRDPF